LAGLDISVLPEEIFLSSIDDIDHFDLKPIF